MYHNLTDYITFTPKFALGNIADISGNLKFAELFDVPEALLLTTDRSSISTFCIPISIVSVLKTVALAPGCCSCIIALVTVSTVFSSFAVEFFTCSRYRGSYSRAPISMNSSTLCTRETPKRVLLQTVKTQMKCRIMRHFIRVYMVCYDKKRSSDKNYNTF